MPNTGNTSTFVFAGWSTYSPLIISMDPPGESIETLSDDDLSTTGQKTLVPEDLSTIGEMTLEVRFDGEIGDLLIGEVGTGTITYPLKSGDSTAPTVAGTVIIVNWEPGSLDNEGRITGTLTVQPDGKTEWSYTDGAV